MDIFQKYFYEIMKHLCVILIVKYMGQLLLKESYPAANSIYLDNGFSLENFQFVVYQV